MKIWKQSTIVSYENMKEREILRSDMKIPRNGWHVAVTALRQTGLMGAATLEQTILAYEKSMVLPCHHSLCGAAWHPVLTVHVCCLQDGSENCDVVWKTAW